MVPSESLLTTHWGTHFGLYCGLVTSLHRHMCKLRKRFKRNPLKKQIKCKKWHSSQQKELHFEPRPSLRDSVNALLVHFVQRGSILHCRHDPSVYFTGKYCFFCQAITLLSIPRISLRRPSSCRCSISARATKCVTDVGQSPFFPQLKSIQFGGMIRSYQI